MREFALGARVVGPGYPVFVVAEGGVNHNGDPALAHRLVDLAADAGADAIKFQMFEPAKLAAADATPAPYQAETTHAADQRTMLEALVLPEPLWPELAGHAAERDLVFLSTAFDVDSADVIDDLDVPAFKVPSGELNNLELVADLAGRGRPLVISTGMATLDEVGRAVAAAAAAPGVCLLHCVTAYPTPSAASNLRALPTLAGRFEVPVGWSDHTRGWVTSVGAVALGASVLEKHITVDRSLPGPDHAASEDGVGFADYVAAIREVESALGDGVKRPVPIEEENRVAARRSIHAARDLDAGEKIRREDVVFLRPATGLPPDTDLAGLVLRRPVTAGRPITPDDVS